MGSDRRTCRISSYRNRNQTGINPKISRTGPELDFCDLIDLPGDYPGPSAKSPEIPKPAGQIAMTAGAGTNRTAGHIAGSEILEELSIGAAQEIERTAGRLPDLFLIH